MKICPSKNLPNSSISIIPWCSNILNAVQNCFPKQNRSSRSSPNNLLLDKEKENTIVTSLDAYLPAPEPVYRARNVIFTVARYLSFRVPFSPVPNPLSRPILPFRPTILRIPGGCFARSPPSPSSSSSSSSAILAARNWRAA